MIYVVLGMHKSGTTLISQTLHASGINMGEFDSLEGLLGYDEGHKYERLASQVINRRMLRNVKSSLSVLGTNKSNRGLDAAGYEYNDDAAVVINEKALNEQIISGSERDNISRLVKECCDRHQNWGFKDPRTCLTYSLWAEELPEHKLIVVYRNYSALFKRMLRRRRHKIPIVNLPRVYALCHAWTLHNVRIIEYLQATTMPALVLNYDEFMRTPGALERLSAFVGKPLTDVRKPELYRNRPRDTILTMPPLTRALFPFLPRSPDSVLTQLTQWSASDANDGYADHAQHGGYKGDSKSTAGLIEP